MFVYVSPRGGTTVGFRHPYFRRSAFDGVRHLLDAQPMACDSAMADARLMQQDTETTPRVLSRTRLNLVMLASAIVAVGLAVGMLAATAQPDSTGRPMDLVGGWELVEIFDDEGPLDWTGLHTTPWLAIRHDGSVAYSDGCNRHASYSEPLVAAVEDGRLIISGGPVAQTLLLCPAHDRSNSHRPNAGMSFAWILNSSNDSHPEVRLSADGATLELQVDDLVAVLEARSSKP